MKRKVYLLICIATYIAMRFLCDGYIDIATDIVMSGLITGVYTLVCWCLDDIEDRRKAEYMNKLDSMYTGHGPDYINFNK